MTNNRPTPQAGAPAILDSPEEVLSTMDRDGKRRWLYPIPSSGRLYRWRFVVGWALIALYLLLPVVQIGGKPAIFLDLLHRQFTFFGLTLYATDTIVLMVFLLFVLLSVFFATALLGRVWCGWGCPQTVYMEFVFRPIERLVEGKESVRRRRDQAGPSFDRTWRKVVKTAIYAVIALVLANTFIAYFVSWPVLVDWMVRPPTENWGFFLAMAIITALVLFDFGYFREQMCTIACPYARLQSVLMDRDSLIVSYDPTRGEQRGRRTRAQREREKAGLAVGLGDCIDCGACVRTCPTGIDIRDGLQMECIGCTQCIDACDAIMISIDKPVGLIRYTSENALDKKPTRILRPRVVVYGALLAVLGALFTVLITGRHSLDVNVVRTAGDPFIILPDGEVANRLRFRVQNRAGGDVTAHIVAVEPAGTEVRLVGPQTLQLSGNQIQRTEAFVVVPPEAFEAGSVPGRFEVRTSDGRSEAVDFTLIGPSERP